MEAVATPDMTEEVTGTGAASVKQLLGSKIRLQSGLDKWLIFSQASLTPVLPSSYPKCVMTPRVWGNQEGASEMICSRADTGNPDKPVWPQEVECHWVTYCHCI